MQAILALLPLAASVSAHTIFQELYVNGVSQGHLNGIRYPNYDGPIENVSLDAMACNGGPNPLTTPFSQTVINVPAGAEVWTEWHHTLDSKGTNDPADPIDPTHKGPIMTYLAAVPNATQTSTSGLNWFKIYEDGYDPATGVWAVDKMIANKGIVKFKIPACLANGNYFLRHELVALHSAGGLNGAQFYMECAQINITGGGGVVPSSTVSFPGAYSATDPGILISVYYPPITNYIIPGPRPFVCGASSSSSSPSSSSSSSTTTTRTTTTTTTRTSTSTSTAAGPQVTRYGQCGGSNYSGSTTCVTGTTCTVINEFYSQCL